MKKLEKVAIPVTNKKKKTSLIIKILIGFLVFVIALIPFSGSDDESKIKQYLSLTEVQAKEMLVVFNEIGITDIAKIERNEWIDGLQTETSIGYNVDIPEFRNIALYIDDGKLLTVQWDTYTFFENYNALLNFKDFILTTTEKSEYKFTSTEMINPLLKSPSTAKYPNINEWRFGKNNGIVTTQGYVDSQNSFGATIRSQFQIKFDNKNSDEVISFIFDGIEYIK